MSPKEQSTSQKPIREKQPMDRALLKDLIALGLMFVGVFFLSIGGYMLWGWVAVMVMLGASAFIIGFILTMTNSDDPEPYPSDTPEYRRSVRDPQ